MITAVAEVLAALVITAMITHRTRAERRETAAAIRRAATAVRQAAVRRHVRQRRH